jgi:outer membrane translocation and assembly module TamA
VAPAHVRKGGLYRAALLFLYLTAACGQKVVHRPGEEWLESIKIEGNKSIKTKHLREGLALRRVQKQGASPDPYLVVVDGKRIEGEYIRQGFLEVDVRSRVERHGDKTTVIYTVQEGPRAKTRVMITGIPKNDPDLTVEMVRDALPIKEGEPFSYEPYDEAKERMLGIIEDAGYAHARLNAHVIVDRANHEAIIHLDYDVGPKARFGTIDILGADEDLEDAVRARVSFEEGEVYSAAAIAETQRRIYDMRRFSMVRVLPDKGANDTINVKISLARSARNELVTGGGVGMDPATYEVRGRAGYTITSFPFPLTDLSVDLRPAYAMLRDGSGYEPRIRALTKLRRIDLFRPFIVGEVEGGYTYTTVEAYTSYGPRARVGLQSPLFTRALQVRGGWEIERLDFRHIDPLIDPMLEMELGLDDTQRVGMYTQAISLDLRDNPIETTFGAFAELRVDEGTPYAGSSLTFLRVTPELRGYVPVPRAPIVLAARARGGRYYGDVPATMRYFSGGASFHRGFGERRLAPSRTGEVDGDGRTVPYGGEELFETNLEVRSRLGKLKGMGVGGVAFLDGGDVVEQGQHVDLSNLHWAAGLGVRLYTIVGAVRADLGYRLNRTGFMEPEPGSKFAFHLSIGEAF